MARQRIVKPEFFTHEGLYSLGEETGLGLYLSRGFEGLWTQADCMGLFEWRPLRLKLQILPWYTVDFAKILDVLEKDDFVRSYEVNGKRYGWIVSWKRNQRPHRNEIEDGPMFPEPTFEDYTPWVDPASVERTPENGAPARARSQARSKAPAQARPKHVRERAQAPSQAPAQDAFLLLTHTPSKEGGNARADAHEAGATAPEPPTPLSAAPPSDPEPESPPTDIADVVADEWRTECAIFGAKVPIARADRDRARSIADIEPDPERRKAVMRHALGTGFRGAFRFFAEDFGKWSEKTTQADEARAESNAVAPEIVPDPPPERVTKAAQLFGVTMTRDPDELPPEREPPRSRDDQLAALRGATT